MIQPSSYEMMVFEKYKRLYKKYLPPEEEYEEGDDELAKEHAFWEIGSSEELGDDEIEDIINHVRKWKAEARK